MVLIRKKPQLHDIDAPTFVHIGPGEDHDGVDITHVEQHVA